MNCQECPYRKQLAKMFDVHVWKEDCGKFGTECCMKPIDTTARATERRLTYE